jgi:hypothetical protein
MSRTRSKRHCAMHRFHCASFTRPFPNPACGVRNRRHLCFPLYAFPTACKRSAAGRCIACSGYVFVPTQADLTTLSFEDAPRLHRLLAA